MLRSESAYEMYSRLNVVEEVNGLGLTQMQPSDIVRKILSVLFINNYGHIMTVLHQGDLSTATPTQILGKINAHEMYMHITPQEGSSSSKKKDLSFKASHEKRSEVKIAHDNSSDDEVDDASLALMVRKTAKMLKKLNKNGVKFDGKKKKFFTSSRRKSISKMDCYNCEELGHLDHNAPNPRKTSTRRSIRARKTTQVIMMMMRRKTSHTRRNFTRRRRMARLILLVIGLRTLNHLVAYPMIKVMMRRRMLLLL
jgi:hypothetical protein